MYGKIFEQIYDSSIAEDWTVRTVFQDFIVLADINGVVDRTPESIARRTNVPLEVVKAAIIKLEAPDPCSRTPGHDGARIRRLDKHRNWGWEIINHAHYRALASEEQRREATKVRTRKYRNRRKLLDAIPQALAKFNCDAPVTQCDAGDAMQKQRQKQMELNSLPVELPHNFPKTKEEAMNQAFKVGCDPEFVEQVWHKAVGRGGRDSKDIPIRSFTSYLATEWSYERARRNKLDQPSKPTVQLRPHEMKTIIEAKEATCADLKMRFASEVAMGTNWNNEQKRREYFNIKKEIKELRAKIASYA